jgi:enoyl-CoA hydratase
MPPLVSYATSGPVAAVTMDDGKVNVLSLALQDELHAALDRAAADRAVVVLAGRDGVFSAGFDLATLRGGGPDAVAMVKGGFELVARLLAFPLPVVMACTGHAVAMGLFLLLSGDYRVGASGPYRLTANEVAIGITMPYAATEILRHRLTPAAFDRAVITAEQFDPADAVGAGLVDRVATAPDVVPVAHEVAARLATLDLDAHAASKLRARERVLDALQAAIRRDEAGS